VARNLSILVPVYNEDGNILPLMQEVQQAFKSFSVDYELVFIDDGSTDATWDQIAKARALEPRVRGIRHTINSGQSAALWTGIQSTSAPLIATLDGDLQNDPADLPKLLAELANYDFVCGVRAKRNDSWLRRFSSRVARAARKAVLKVDFCDTGCAMRVFKRTALQGIFPFNGLHRFLPVLVHGAGAKAKEIPINHRPRIAGVSKYGLNNRLWRGIADLFAIAWYQKRRVNPVPCQELRDLQKATPIANSTAAPNADSPELRTLPHSHTASPASATVPGTNGSNNLEPSFA
jgi:dolichol-phosphate mannosyltransferase